MVSRTNRYFTNADSDTAPPDTPVPDIGRIVDAGVRTLFLVGERDTVAPPAVTKALQAKMTGSDLVTFETSGHSPYWEVPNEFNRIVLELPARMSSRWRLVDNRLLVMPVLLECGPLGSRVFPAQFL